MSGQGGAGTISILQLSLHDHLVGHLAGYRSGRNILLFAPEFAREHQRPTLGLITHIDWRVVTGWLPTPSWVTGSSSPLRHSTHLYPLMSLPACAWLNSQA